MIDVTFEGVSKRYAVADPARPASSWLGHLGRGKPDRDFWAVKDVSFEVGRGETLGIIGHNGAGKSTLLKLLSRITAPTEGTITLNGRLAALIELGSGFHPELTGRENVFLSGSLLGMRRREIQDKLDRIVAFADIGDFIDTPVKWYSSGMYVRLGFAIAAHLEPDILLVDEVLAVGDAAFQLQCIERLNELRRGGTTMLFISHDLLTIEKLCDRVVLMQRGRLVSSGVPHDVVATYQRSALREVAEIADAVPGTGAGLATIEGIDLLDDEGRAIGATRTGDPMRSSVRFTAQREIPDAVVEVFFYSRDGRTLLCQQTTAHSGGDLTLAPGPGAIEFWMPAVGLQPGLYTIGATIRERSGSGAIDWYYGRTSLYVEPGRAVRGYFYAAHDWRRVDPVEVAGGRLTATNRTGRGPK